MGFSLILYKYKQYSVLGLFLFLLTCCTSVSSENSTNHKLPQFHDRFQSLQKDTCMVFSSGGRGDFKGTILTDTEKKLLLTLFQDSTLLHRFTHFPSDSPIRFFDWYSTYNFPLPTKKMGYVIRIETDYVHSNGIYVLVYDTRKKAVIDYYELANRYSIGGNDGFKRSWLLDVNSNGYKDIFTVNEKQQRYYDESDDLNSDEEWFVVDDSLWVTLQHWDTTNWKNTATYQLFTKEIFVEEDAEDKGSQVEHFFYTPRALSVGITNQEDLLSMQDALERHTQ